jgi:hypothetical protein
MPQDANCPKCKHVFPVTQARHPVGVRCPGCEVELTAEFRKRPAPIEPGISPYELLVKPGKPAGGVTEPPPTPKKPRREDDDEDEEKEKSTGKGSSIIVLFSGLIALLFAVAGLGTTGYFLFTNLDTSDSTINTISNPNNFGNNRPANNNSGNDQVGITGEIPGSQNSPPPKRNTFEFAPVTGTLPSIKPASLSADALTLPLGSKVGTVAIGGGGRYIVMHFPESGNLGVFDVNTALMTLIETDSGDVRLAAGLSRIVTLVPSANAMRVFSIVEPKGPEQKLTIQKLFDSGVPVNGIGSIAMGSKTEGPVIGVGTFGDIHVLDISNNNVLEIEEGRSKDSVKLNWAGCVLRATPDGMAYISCDNLDRGNKTKIAYVDNKKWKSRDLDMAPFPGADGLLYGNSIVMNLRGDKQRYGGIGLGSDEWFVPAVCGNTGAFVKVVQTGGKGPGAKKTIMVSIHNRGNASTPAEGTPMLSGLPEFDGLWGPFGQVTKEKPLDHQFFLLHEAKLLAILSASRDKLLIRRIEVK